MEKKFNIPIVYVEENLNPPPTHVLSFSDYDAVEAKKEPEEGIDYVNCPLWDNEGQLTLQIPTESESIQELIKFLQSMVEQKKPVDICVYKDDYNSFDWPEEEVSEDT